MAAGLDQLGVPANPTQQSMLLDFLALLQKWNRVYSLTAIREPRTAVDLHLLDSLTVWPFLHGQRILDVGTGPGLPGIPLAVLSPHRQFVLLDCNPKKTRFVQQAVIELRLKNVDVVTCRVEQYRGEACFDTVMARAYAALGIIVEQVRPLLAPGGKVLAQKGKLPDAELADIHNLNARSHRLSIPGVSAERHLIDIEIQ